MLLFPACAGVIPESDLWHPLFRPFPRMRGGDPVLGKPGPMAQPFSPHARG